MTVKRAKPPSDPEQPASGQGKSPGYLKRALDHIGAVIPHAERTEFPDAGHNGPDQDAPQAVAARLAMMLAA